jgi:iron(III) transport system ATP-binding protein
MTSPVVRLNEVTKRHDGGGGVECVSLGINAGESIVVVGPSGSGKTTLLRLIAGLEVPDAGAIWIGGQCVADRARNLVPPHHRHVGLVFQDLALWPHLTVRENLEFILSSVGVEKRQRSATILDTLAVCRIDSRLVDRYPHQLSGGEQQRVALARALIGSPRLLLLDEPFSSLDRELHVKLRSELAALRRRLQLTAIYVTHDGDDAEALADRTVKLRAGTIDADRPV